MGLKECMLLPDHTTKCRTGNGSRSKSQNKHEELLEHLHKGQDDLAQKKEEAQLIYTRGGGDNETWM